MNRRLLLVSLGLGALNEFMGGEASKQVIAFIPTAGHPYEDRSFVDRDRDLLARAGYELREVDIAAVQGQELEKALDGVDGIFVAGGNSFFLLEAFVTSGFAELLPRLIERGVPYIGASAGAVVIGPDLRPVQTLDDPGAAPNLADYRGLGIVDFVVLPHYGNEKYEAEYRAIIERYEPELTLVPLRNDQALWVDGDSHRIVASAE